MAIFVEKSVLNSPLAQNLIDKNIEFTLISDVSEVGDSKKNIILVDKKDMYAHPCPATKVYRCCNYHTSDVMEGCPFDCSYCILQAYLGHKNIQVSADVGGISKAIKALSAKGERLRLGTGELSDSLALDNIFPFSKLIVPIINNQDNIKFEFKTKSVCIENLLNLNPKNIIASWSLNPSQLKGEEELSADPLKRIEAAKLCAEAGYKVGFHFDPLIYYENFTDGYKKLIEELVSSIPKSSVEYISISTFRAPSLLLDKMREREKLSPLLKSDLILGLDGKYRYVKPLRMGMLRFVSDLLKKHWPSVFVYFCMEHASVWEKLKGFDPGEREEFEALFNNN